jgi:hypothetical protein
MLHPRILQQAFIVAAIVQIVWALVGLIAIPDTILFVGRLAIAAGGGYLYGMNYGGSGSASALGGTIVGGASVLPAVILSVVIGSSAGSMIPLASGAAILSGGVGGALGSWIAAWLRKDFQ